MSAIADTLDVAGRNLRTLFRTPQALIFATIQPVIFVLLFRYAFGGAIRVPGTDYVDYLMPGHLRPDGGLRRGRHRGRALRRPAFRHPGPLPHAADGPHRRAWRPHPGRPGPQPASRRGHDRCRLRGGIPQRARRAGPARRARSRDRLRVRGLLGLRGPRAARQRSGGGPGGQRARRVPARLHLRRLRACHRHARLAAGVRHPPAGQRPDQRRTGVDIRRPGRPRRARLPRLERGHAARVHRPRRPCLRAHGPVPERNLQWPSN